MATLAKIIPGSKAHGRSRKAYFRRYAPNYCGVCQTPLADPTAWLCPKCRCGKLLYLALHEYQSAFNE